MRTEPKNTYDQGESSILEFVDGPKDSRFMMTAKALARDRLRGRDSTPLTLQNRKKVTQFRGDEDLERMVQRFMTLETADDGGAVPEARNAEATEMAERESAAVQGMAAGIVPESAKKTAAGPGQPTR